MLSGPRLSDMLLRYRYLGSTDRVSFPNVVGIGTRLLPKYMGYVSLRPPFGSEEV